MPRDGQPPLLSFIFTLFRSSELGRRYGGRREAGVCGRATDVSTDRAGWGDGRNGMRWEINITVTYLPLPGAGLHALSAVSSVFLSPLSFRADCVHFAAPSVSLFHRCTEVCTRDSQQLKRGAKHFNLTSQPPPRECRCNVVVRERAHSYTRVSPRIRSILFVL